MKMPAWLFFFQTKQEHKAKRVCARCKQPIKAKHKWQFIKNRTVHKDCQNPELKQPPTPIEQLPLFKDQNNETNTTQMSGL